MAGLPIQEASLSSAFIGSQIDQKQSTSSTVQDSKPKKKICCACPDTKRLRDECIVEHGEDSCSKWIDAHLRCLRAEGFKV